MDNNDFKRFLGMKDYIEVDCFIASAKLEFSANYISFLHLAVFNF